MHNPRIPAAFSLATRASVKGCKRWKEDWSQYVEQLGHFFAANGIHDTGRMRAVFLFIVGASTYQILRNLVTPKKLGENTYDILIDVLLTHFKLTPTEIVEHCRFHSCLRMPGESVATFVAELRSLSEFCNFGDTLNTMIRDRHVWVTPYRSDCCGIGTDIH